MKIALFVLVVLVGIVLVLGVTGFLLPKDHVAMRAAHYAKPTDEVFASVRDVASAAGWRRDVERVEMLTPSGDRERWREYGKRGAITYELVEETPPRRRVVRIADEGLGYGGSWTFELAPAGDGGTELVVVEQGFVSNPMLRTIASFFSPTESLDAFLVDLGGKLGERIEPRDAR